MTDQNGLGALWREQQTATFPFSANSAHVQGTGLARLDAGLGGLLTRCLKSDAVIRPFSDQGLRDLRHYIWLAELALTSPSLKEDAFESFKRLVTIAQKGTLPWARIFVGRNPNEAESTCSAAGELK